MSHIELNEEGNCDLKQTEASTEDNFLYESPQKRCADDQEWTSTKSSRSNKMSETNTKRQNKDWSYARNIFSPVEKLPTNLRGQRRRTPFSQVLSRLNYPSPDGVRTCKNFVKTNTVHTLGQLCTQKKRTEKSNTQISRTSNHEAVNVATESPSQPAGFPSPVKATTSDEVQTQIVWSISDDETDTDCVINNDDPALKSSLDPDYELDLLIAAIKNDKRKVKSTRQSISESKESYREQYRTAIEKEKASRAFLVYEQEAGIREGANAVVKEVEISYGVCRVIAALENDTRCSFLINKRTQSVKVGDKLKLFFESSKEYHINGVEVFLEPNKVVVV